MHIIPDSAFKPAPHDNTDPNVFKSMNYLQFDSRVTYIEVMDEYRILCVGFEYKMELYNIEEDPLCPKLKASTKNYGVYHQRIVKLDEK